MADYTVKRIDEMEAGFGGGFVKVRAELGVTAFGMQLIQLPPDYPDYPEHDHAETARRRSIVALDGSGQIDIEGERVELDAGRVRARRRPAPSARCSRAPRGCAMLVDRRASRRGVRDRPATELTGAAS